MVLICISLMADDGGHFFMYWSFGWSLFKVPVQIFLLTCKIRLSYFVIDFSGFCNIFWIIFY